MTHGYTDLQVSVHVLMFVSFLIIDVFSFIDESAAGNDVFSRYMVVKEALVHDITYFYI